MKVIKLPKYSSQDLHAALKNFFGYDSFRPGQEKIIDYVVNNRKDCLVYASTSYGKSILGQLPALILPGITVVVSPLVSLMKDQVEALNRKGLPATFVNSSLSPNEQNQRLRDSARGLYKLLYVSPERFKSKNFRELCEFLDVSLLAIDEIHCISSYGHEFRPDYMRLAGARELLGNPPLIGLTATATPVVKNDIRKSLKLSSTVKQFTLGFSRPNLTIETKLIHDDDKFDKALDIIDEHETGIVYCSTRRQVEELYRAFLDYGIDCQYYHGEVPNKLKEQVQNDFMSGKTNVVVATSAFGMGIDRADLRFVVVYNIASSVEEAWQMVGRAGRDEKPAYGYIFGSQKDVGVQKYFIDLACPPRYYTERFYAYMCKMTSTNETIDVISKKLKIPGGLGGACSSLLVNKDFIERIAVKGQRSKKTVLKGGIRPLNINWVAQEERKKVLQANLQAAIDLFEADCPTKYILDYFEDEESDFCGRCGSCQIQTMAEREAASVY